MITSAYIHGREESAKAIHTLAPNLRGDKTRPMGVTDLLQFGRSPWRWRHAPDPDDMLVAHGPVLGEWFGLDAEHAQKYFVARPATYEAMRLECPRCGSTGPAASCKKCGQRRRNVVRPRPWSSAAKTCAAWSEKQVAAGLRVISPRDWERAQGVANQLRSHPGVQKLAEDGLALRTLDGVWQDEETDLKLHVWTRASLLPVAASASIPALALVVCTRDASPASWDTKAYLAGLHIWAALALYLFNHASDANVREFLWVTVEDDPPHLLSLRRASPELLEEGRRTLAALLAAYALALQRNAWPTFTDGDGTRLEDWEQLTPQKWLTSGTGEGGGYFAPDALQPADNTAPAHAQEA